MANTKDETLTTHYVRSVRRALRYLTLALLAFGVRLGTQNFRQLERLFTFHPGERAELDYTKFAILLYPLSNWDEPKLFYVGIGVDHRSGVIKGYTITAQPTAISGVRLYKNCVLPGLLWLPKRLAEKYGQEFDICGFDRLIAIDNARDLQSNAVTAMFLLAGVIVLCVPPKRGDLKGTVERTIKSLEEIFFRHLKGYVENVNSFLSEHSKHLRQKAKENARYTVDEFEELLLLAILAYNKEEHPDDKRPRIQVYREGIDFLPPILPVGRVQIDTIFSMTYSVAVTREGVQAETWHYNSKELGTYCRVGGPKANVHIPVDDAGTAIVYHPELIEPLLVPMVTHSLDGPLPIEYVKVVLNEPSDDRFRVSPDGEGVSAMDRFFNRVAEIEQAKGPVKGSKRHEATTAAAQSAKVAPVTPRKREPMTDAELKDMFEDDGTED